MPNGVSYFCLFRFFRQELWVGAVLREQNALPYESSVTNCRLAKDAIDNGGAGRAAKSAIPGRSLARYSGRSLHSLFRRYAPYATLLTPTTKIGYLCELGSIV